MSEYLCNLVVPGFPKSGTSSLHSYLNQHPEICMSSPKESHYFAVASKWELGENYHNSLFGHCVEQHRYYGESSTIYCICEKSAERIKQHLDAPKVILLLRDPVERLVSHYNWLFKLGLENRSILEAVEASDSSFDPDCPIPGSGNYMSYLSFSSYSKYVPMWVSLFKEDNVKIVVSENLSKFPLQVVNECLEFLGLSPLSAFNDTVLNKTSDARHVFRKNWATTLESCIPQSLINFAAKSEAAKKLWQRSANASKVITTPQLSDGEVNQLRKILQTEIEFYRTYSDAG